MRGTIIELHNGYADNLESKLEKYVIGHYVLHMRKGQEGYAGHYTDNSTRKTFTFSAPGMSKKKIIKSFWDRVNKLKNLK
ncbi:hypothetical protein FDJ58_gp093 [Bacillus phage SIOphi]|uniref:Uncharacterized protein n=1 Tax=Bacillus phage SIOphi TaxID=1285382 RepID=R4JGL0_9CAUD|nr:hypothetical protein FDJ58_gp093 [Bacillus phage SIOphi]AGK86901.1 hypothetical protein SIOphi_00465 [Bacillus phage SIOphi]OLF87136.1 hypothetical protein B4089_3606 [Bacillus licheniformis]OLF87263.1 hypothetical protein B4089_3733 [Bacillus licheniformis]